MIDKRQTSLRKLRLENLEARELLSASTLAEVAALTELTSDAAIIAQSDDIAPIDLKEVEGAATTLVVDTLEDVVDDTDGKISLREAVNIANMSGGFTITFDASLRGGTIMLNGVSGPISITNGMTIDATALSDAETPDRGAAEPGITVSAFRNYVETNGVYKDVIVANKAQSSIFVISATDALKSGASTVEFKGLKLTGAGSQSRGSSASAIYAVASGLNFNLNVDNCVFADNIPYVRMLSGGFGAYVSNSGNSTFTNVTFDNNGYVDSRDGYVSSVTIGTQYLNYEGGALNLQLGSAVISNSIFTNNDAQAMGGAVYATNTNVTFENTLFENNTINLKTNQGGGGAVASVPSTTSLAFDGCDFIKNESVFAGAIYTQGDLTINDSTFSENVSSDYTLFNNVYPGTVVYARGNTALSNVTITEDNDVKHAVYFASSGNASTKTISDSVIRNDNADGTAVYNQMGNAEITRSTLSGGQGAAFSVLAGTPKLVNSLVTDSAVGILANSASNPTIEVINSDIVGNTTGVKATNGVVNLKNTIVVMNGTDVEIGNGTVNANNTLSTFTAWSNSSASPVNYVYADGDPLFIDAANGDYGLAAGAIAIDGGNNSYIAGYDTDFDGEARIFNGTVDLGAYESQIAYETPSIIVTTTDDVVDPNDGLISLREAVEVYFAYDSRTFDAAVDYTGQTVTFNLAEPGDVFLEEGEITISDAMTIYGGTSATITIDGCYQSRIFNVADGVESVEFQGLILQRGKADKAAGAYYTSGDAYDEAFEAYDGGAIYATTAAITVKDSEIDDNAGYIGGAIFVNGGTLTIENTTFENNDSAYQGGAIAVYGAGSTDAALVVADSSFESNESDRAGAIYFKNGVASVSGTTFDQNEAAYASGGAITVSNATFTATDVELTNNDAGRFGGAMFAGTSTVTINNGEGVAISGNSAQYGGALYASKSGLEVVSGTFEDNWAEYSGGAIFSGSALTVAGAFDGNEAGKNGGAIYAISGVDATDATFTSNAATNSGGAIYAVKGVVSVTNATFEENSSTLSGGAVRLAQVETATFENATFTSNVSSAAGGAISAGATGQLTIDGGSFVSNSATNTGGAIYATDTVVSIANAEYDGNQSEKFGGAIAAVNGAELTVDGGTIKNGTALAGGAIYVANSAATITADIQTNSASTYGGAVYGVESAITAVGAAFSSNTAEKSGGAIYVATSSVALTNTTLTGNVATTGPGGAIYATSTGETLTIQGGEVSGNSAANSGGAIYAYHTAVVVEVGVDENSEETATVFAENESEKFGGAIYVAAASADIEGATFTGNEAETGGAIYAGGNVTLTDATFTSNAASNWGGALYMKDGVASFTGVEFSENTAASNGGALYLHTATATLTDATFSENTAASYGGAIEMVNGSLTISTSTFAKNVAQNAGGAIYQLHGATTISGATFSENEATTKAGALYVGSGESTISGSTFSDNDSARGAAIYAHAATSLEIDGEAFPATGAIEEEDLSTALLDEAFAELFVEDLD